MSIDDLDKTIKNELEQAYKAQEEGKEGLARVCARRAAGWALKSKLQQEGVDLHTPSAFEYLKHQLTLEGNSERMTTALEHLILKVAKDSPDQDSYWPLPDVNLVKEAHWVVEEILEIKIDI